MNAEERLTEATEWFIRMHSETVQEEDLEQLHLWLAQHPDNATCYQQVSSIWAAVGEFASAPELMLGRRDALEHARRASARRWASRVRIPVIYGVAASLIGAFALLAVLWTSGFWGDDVYETSVGERRALTLQDGSIVNLDARSRLRVRFGDAVRSITLESGQASFDVARDPTRPFRVRAGEHTIVALGTVFNIEVVRDTLLVTLIEGRVAVVPTDKNNHNDANRFSQNSTDAANENAAATGQPPAESTVARVIELTAGQQLVATGQTLAHINNNVDLGRATAWQTGQLFFNDEPLIDAVARMNRYASVPIAVDPQISGINISGVFRAGDVNAFTDAITAYFPVRIAHADTRQILLVPAAPVAR